MSRITIEIAKNVAKKMTAEKTKEVKALESQLSEIASKLSVEGIPNKVMKYYNEFPKYFNTESMVVLNGNGVMNKYVNCNRYPHKSENGYKRIELNQDQGVLVSQLENKIDSARKQMSTLVMEIEQALKSMRTFNKVKELFPEAYEFLPKTESAMLPSININSIREKLK